jgi:hypothetical protein
LGEILIVDMMFRDVDYGDGSCIPFEMGVRDTSLADLGNPSSS